MKCQTVDRRVSAYLDGMLPEGERREVAAHLECCPRCQRQSQQLAQVRSRLAALPAPPAPPQLATELRVLASREIARRRRYATLGTLARHWIGTASLTINNLMRPWALPFAGGLASAVFLFSMLVPNFAQQTSDFEDDVPTMLSTEASLKSSLSFAVLDDDVVVDVLIDESGRVVDYAIPVGQNWASDDRLRRSVENTLLCTRFTPATMFGQPATGRTRITLRRSHVEVKG